MRDYGKVSPKFWTGNTGREIRKQGQCCQLAALYLLTAPGATMLGVYHLPAVTLGHAIGSPLEGALKALRSLSEAGFCVYDEESEWVWVREMAKYQIDDELDPKDNRCKSVAKEWLGLPQLPFLDEFFNRYAQAFHLPERKPLQSPFKAPPKPLRSQEQEQEQEQEQKTPHAPSPSDSTPTFLGEPFITLPTNTGQPWAVYAEMVADWQKLYPAVDVEQQLRNMRGWCDAKPSNRKTKAGMRAFIANWLSREQNRAASPPTKAPSSRLQTPSHEAEYGAL